MPAPFAALETRINAVALAKLANVTATVAGQPVDGVRAMQFVEQMGVEGMRPTFAALDSALPAVAHGTAVSLGADAYRVIGIQPDEGITTLILERA